MRSIFLAALLAGALAAPLARSDDRPAGLALGDRPPDLALTLVDGSTRPLHELAGERATVLYFMATW